MTMNEYDGLKVMLDEATEAGPSESVPSGLYPGPKTFHAVVTGSGSVAAGVDIEASNDNENWLRLGTITLSGTDVDSDGFPSSAAWAYHRANLISLTAGNKVSVRMAA
jgi:hypothetical protein